MTYSYSLTDLRKENGFKGVNFELSEICYIYAVLENLNRDYKSSKIDDKVLSHILFKLNHLLKNE